MHLINRTPTLLKMRDVEIDEATLEVRRDGRLVAVEPRVFDFILYLARNRHRVVSKDELVSEVWDQRVLGESVLTRCACLARQVLGDPLAIKTYYKRGYRWMARLEVLSVVDVSRIRGKT